MCRSCTDPVCGEMWIDVSCGKVILGGELVMIVASMIGRSESSKDGWCRESHENICREGWKR